MELRELVNTTQSASASAGEIESLGQQQQLMIKNLKTRIAALESENSNLQKQLTQAMEAQKKAADRAEVNAKQGVGTVSKIGQQEA